MNEDDLDAIKYEMWKFVSDALKEYKVTERKGVQMSKQYLSDNYDFVADIDEGNTEFKKNTTLFKNKDGTEWVFGKLNEDSLLVYISAQVSNFDALNLSLPSIKIDKFLEYDSWHDRHIYSYIVDRYNIVYDQQSYEYLGGAKLWRALTSDTSHYYEIKVNTYGFNSESNEFLRNEDGTIMEFDMTTSIWLPEKDKPNIVLVITKEKIE